MKMDCHEVILSSCGHRFCHKFIALSLPCTATFVAKEQGLPPAHLTQDVKAASPTSLGVIPAGLAFDTDVTFVYRRYDQQFGSEWADSDRDNRWIATSRRISGTHLTARACARASEQLDIGEPFLSKDHLWPTADGNHVNVRNMPDYKSK